MGARTLVASPSSLLRGQELAKALALAGKQLDDVDVLLGSTSALDGGTSGRYADAVVLSTSRGLNAEFVGGVVRLLEPGAAVIVQHGDQESQAEILRTLLLGGLTDFQAAGRQIRANVPSWDVGAASALSLKRREPSTPTTATAAAAAPAPAPTPAPPQRTWALNPDDGEGDEELLDDEALLTEADRARPVPAAAKDDCEVGAAGRKACKDCTCGRAEAEARGEKAVLTQEMLDNPQAGGCGNCALGDAFRCAGCPYRGLPAFQPGKKIELGADFLTADA